MNAAIKRFVSQDISNLIISINNYVMSIFNEKRSQNFSFVIPSKQIQDCENNIRSGKQLTVVQSNSHIFLVNRNIIGNIKLKTCTCLRAYGMKYPCIHICAVLLFLTLDPYAEIDEYFKVSNY
ncbi:hypothetical protein CDIK_0969 [Cucumispora dikerogammari]|nr:hypothetical protein CDIK_0969 [Cucumispora dikerogammari]